MQDQQPQISGALGVTPGFDAHTEILRRTQFLCDYAKRANAKCLVLGISGGVDSTTTGLLCQRAAQLDCDRGGGLRFVAVRLPYGSQADEADAQKALDLIQADETLIVDVKAAADATLAQLKSAGLAFVDAAQEDFVLGNIKARQRMIAQYAIAGARSGLVAGTDHAAEALMGFFTKFGDGGFDVTALAGLTKRRVRALAVAMGASHALAQKVPTADLESLRPLLPDEAALGVTYEQIDDYLEGRTVDAAAATVIVQTFARTAHKRALPAGPNPSF